jgi:hypothetical protein
VLGGGRAIGRKFHYFLPCGYTARQLGVAVMNTDHAWVVAAALFAGATFVAYLLKEIAPSLYRHFRIKNPCKVCFVITSFDRGTVDYVIQDDKEHFTRELIVPTNHDVYVQILFKAKIAFMQHQLTLVFENPHHATEPPLVDHYKLQFVRIGESEKFPKADVGHWIDHHDTYHITEERPRAKHQYFTYGFIVKTRDAGNFPMSIGLGFDGSEVDYRLNFIVQEKPNTRMKCTEHFGCWVSPKRVMP